MKFLATAITAVMLLGAGNIACAQETGDSPASGGREIVVGVKEAPPFAMKDASGHWSGVSIELWQQVAKDLHLAFHYAEAPTVQKLLEETAAGKFDVAVAAITVTGTRGQTVDFTQSYYAAGLGIAVPVTGTMSWRPILRAMISFGFLQAVLGLIGLALIAGLLVWFFERRQNEHFSGSVGRGVTSGVWWSTMAMTQRSHNAAGPTTLPGRIVAILWMVSSIIAVAIFTAGITSLLTTKQLQGAVHGVSDLSSVRVGTVAGTAAEETLGKLRIRFRGYASADEGLKAMRRGAIDAFVYDKPLLGWLIKQNYSSTAQLLEITFDP